MHVKDDSVLKPEMCLEVRDVWVMRGWTCWRSCSCWLVWCLNNTLDKIMYNLCRSTSEWGCAVCLNGPPHPITTIDTVTADV